MWLGPAALGAAPEVGEITVRRYLCSRCEAVLTVVPRGLQPRLRYRLGAIVGAVGLWWRGSSAAEVRKQSSPFPRVGEEARRGWRSLRRWTGQLARWVGLRLDRGAHVYAGVVLQRLASRALSSSGDLVVDAVAGVMLVDGHRLWPTGSEAPTM